MPTRAAIAFLCAVLSGPVPAAPVAGAPSTPLLEPIVSLEARDAVHWTLKTDTGLLVVYADGGVHVLDLFDGGKRIGDPIPLPGAEKRRSAAHVSGTNLLLIASANGGLLKRDPAEAAPAAGTFAISPAQTVPTERAYAINMATGRVLWDAESFELPVQTILFPKVGVLVIRSGREGDQLAAFEVTTGRRLWSSRLRAEYVNTKGGMLEVLGEDSGLIEPVSGQRHWGFSMPSEELRRVLVFPTRDRMVLWDGNDFEGFAVPVPDTPGAESGSPETAAPKSIWKFEAEDSMPYRCRYMRTCWAQVISGDQVLIVSKHHVEMLDSVTGKVVWTREKNGVWIEFPVSPSGKTGVELGSGEMAFVEVEKGEDTFRLDAPERLSGEKENQRARWLDENELLVVNYDYAGRPRDMARYDVAGRKLLWNRALPEPAKYRLTAKQKGGIVGAVFGALVLGAAMAAAPAPAFPTGPVMPPIIPYPVSGPLAANLRQDGSMADEVQDDAVGASAESGLPEGILAWDRRQERQRRIREAESSEVFIVSGEDDAYRVLAVDVASGNERPVSEYRHKKVHFMDVDVASRLVISTEDNKRMLRLLAPSPSPRPESPSESDPPDAKGD